MRSKTEDERATASFLERHLVCTVSATAGADPDGRVARFWVDEWGQPGKVSPIRVGGGGWGGEIPAHWHGCGVIGWCGGPPLPTSGYMPPNTCATTIFPTIATGYTRA